MFSKFVVAIFCAWVAVVLVVVTALIVGSIVFGTDAIGPPLSFFTGGAVDRRHPLPPRASSTAYVSWSLTGVVAFSFMVSCMTDAPFGAIFAGVGLYFTSLILDAITSLGNIRYVLPTHYFDALGRPAHPAASGTPTCGAACSSNSPTCWSSSSIGLWWFRRKDIKS